MWTLWGNSVIVFNLIIYSVWLLFCSDHIVMDCLNKRSYFTAWIMTYRSTLIWQWKKWQNSQMFACSHQVSKMFRKMNSDWYDIWEFSRTCTGLIWILKLGLIWDIQYIYNCLFLPLGLCVGPRDMK